MNKITFYAVLASASLLALSACKETNNYNNDDGTPIRLSSRVELGSARLQEGQIVEGRKLSFFVTEAGEGDAVLYDNQEIIANGTGGFGYQQTMYYPSNGNEVDFYAVHPYNAEATLGSTIPFSITANQSTDDGYLDSDLLYATNMGVARTTAPVSLQFTHKLVKLDFTIIQGDGSDISDLSAVTTLSALPSLSIDPLTGNLSEASGTRTEIISHGVAAPQNGNTEASGISAIIVPQTFSAGQRLFRIRLGNIDYYYTPDQNIVFVGGYSYDLRLTIRQVGIELESSISEWLDGGTIDGDGTLD